MKRNYEIALMQHVAGSVVDDYETVAFISEYGYHKLHKIAKDLSMHYGESNVGGFRFPKREKDDFCQGLDEGLAMVKIVCYTETPESSYEPLYYQYYDKGKVDYKVTFEWK